jgi:hypothetical protein
MADREQREPGHREHHAGAGRRAEQRAQPGGGGDAERRQRQR